jgi:diacylglycerol kinase (ATP)
MRICPEARIDDGLLDIVVVGRISKPELAKTMRRVYRGTHARHPLITTYRARRVTVSAPDVTAYADGEPVGELPVVCEAVSDAVRVLAPEA